MAIEQNVTLDDHVFIGEDKTINFTIYEASTPLTPVNISGWTLRWDLRKKPKDIDPAILTKTIGNGITILDPAAGTGKITLGSTETDVIKPNVELYHSLKRMDTDQETVLIFGTFIFGQTTVH